MQITLVAHEIGTPGGMERQLAELASALLEDGWKVTVVARSCELEARTNLRFVRVGGPRRFFSVWFPWFFLFGSIAVARHRSGLLHTTGALVGNRADLSTVHFCHEAFHRRTDLSRSARPSRLYRLNSWVASQLSRVAERRCYRPEVTRRLVAVSAGVAAELREYFPRASISEIPNGVDREAFAPDPNARERLHGRLRIDEASLVALFVGSEWERKGLRFAIEGVARAPDWHLVVVGGGDLERFSRLAAAAGAGERVHFEGVLRDVAPYYPGADAFLLPTAYETFSLVAFEAAAAGLPLLVSRVSGVEDLLVEGRNGWFIDRDAEVIAQRLEALRDDDRRRRMGREARADTARFDWQQVAAAYERLYEEVASP